MLSGDLAPSAGVCLPGVSSGAGEEADTSVSGSCFHEKRLCTAGPASFSSLIVPVPAALRRRSEGEEQREMVSYSMETGSPATFFGKGDGRRWSAYSVMVRLDDLHTYTAHLDF